jgi:hypothetical protein
VTTKHTNENDDKDTKNKVQHAQAGTSESEARKTALRNAAGHTDKSAFNQELEAATSAALGGLGAPSAMEQMDAANRAREAQAHVPPQLAMGRQMLSPAARRTQKGTDEAPEDDADDLGEDRVEVLPVKTVHSVQIGGGEGALMLSFKAGQRQVVPRIVLPHLIRVGIVAPSI